MALVADAAAAVRDEALVKSASELVDRLRERAPRGEALRRVPDETMAEVEAAGLHLLTFPRSRGGYHASMRTQVDVLSEISRGDGSTSWAVAVYNAIGYWVCGFSDEALDEFFASGNPKSAGVFSAGATATAVQDGYLVSGRWPFATGQHHAGWIVVPGVVEGRLIDGVPDVQAFLVPKHEFSVADDWQVAGLVATGSNTVSLDKVFVPAYRAHSFADAAWGRFASKQLASDPYYRTPLVPIIVGDSLGTPLGLARAALEMFRERIHRRGITYMPYTRQADAVTTHIQMAEASMKLEQAEFHANHMADMIDTTAATGGEWDIPMRVRCRADIAWCLQLCRETVEIIQKASGANAIRLADPLQRIVKDIQTLSLHAYLLYSSNAEIYGRVLCGLDPGVPEV